MAIAPLAIPQLGAVSGGVDWQPLANLGKVYEQAANKRALQDALSGGIDTSNPHSLSQLAARVLPYDSTTGLSLAQLGTTAANRQQDVAWRQQEAQRAQQNADRSYGLQVRAADRLEETPLDKANQRAEVLRSNGIDPNSPEGRAYMIGGEWTGPGSNKNGLQPIYGTDANGKPVIMQMNPTGVATRTQLPEGVTVSRDPIKIDQGTSYLLLDPTTRQQIGIIPKDLAGAEQQKVLGEETGKAQVALPQVLATSNQTLKSIEDVRTHPGRKWGTGALGTIPGIPGTDQKGFVVALDQLKGKTFLEAFNALRGGGAITEAEGAKATNAMARLDRAQNDRDFESALNDLRDVVKAGMLRAQAKSRGAGQSASASAASTGMVNDPSQGNLTASADPAAPKVGELRDGYRFRGGDPGDPANWAKAQ
jgi:hypothetical protein